MLEEFTMLEFVVKAWDKNKGKLEEDLRNNGDFYPSSIFRLPTHLFVSMFPIFQRA